MKCAYDVLQQKELDILRVRREVEALHFVIPLIADEEDWLEQGIVVMPSLKNNHRQEAVKKLA